MPTSIIVNWQNCSRPPAERIKIEKGYRDRLLELCNSVEHAKKLQDEHRARHQDPTSAWARYNAVAHIEATAGLLPTERRDSRFAVRFE